MWPVSEEGAARADRVQRAREAFFDDWGDHAGAGSAQALDVALDVATRVQITPEIVAAAEASGDYAYVDMLAAAFRAAGFEVEE